MSRTLFVGIDLGSEDNVVCVMDPAGDDLARFTVSNDLPGTERLVEKTLDLVRATGSDTASIGMEATNLYWWHLHQALYDDPGLKAIEATVTVINPKVIDGFKRLYPDMAKTDKIDARVIADCLRFGRVKPSPPPDLRFAPLQRLTRYRYHLVHTLTNEKNRALSLIFLKFSTYAKGCPFSNVFGKASQAVLENLTPDEIVQRPLPELVYLIAQNGNNRLKDVDHMAQILKNISQRAYRLHPKMRDAVDTALAMSLETVRFLEAQECKLNIVIARDLQAIPQTLDTVPGIGPVYTAGTIAEVGDVHRFPDDDALAKFAGLTWRNHQSSKFAAQDLPLTRSGNFYLRYYLVQAANSVRVQEPEFAAFYQRKYNEASHHHHKRALVLTARKLVRLVFALLSKGQVYRERRLRSS
ncbi:MAG: IS110 family transposase [Firmicutes bacterium]|nr:IS110 family transposase [Bacillota bacterium]